MPILAIRHVLSVFVFVNDLIVVSAWSAMARTRAPSMMAPQPTSLRTLRPHMSELAGENDFTSNADASDFEKMYDVKVFV